MKLYEIDAALSALINEDTGEIADYEAFAELQMEKEQKCENIALALKNARAEAEAIKTELDALIKRRKAAESRAERLKDYLAEALGGEKLKTGRVSVSYRRAKSVKLDDSFVKWAAENSRDDLLRYKEPEADKKAIKTELEGGAVLPGAELVDNISVIVR
jgi:hypothetical protein